MHGTLHGPGIRTKDGSLGRSFQFPGGDLSKGFHLYAVEWGPDAIDFFVDSYQYAHFTREDYSRVGNWVFDHPFFIILNLAIGGDWPGSPSDDEVGPFEMRVVSLRAYR
jgi:beta-glucanase (GH16 family)